MKILPQTCIALALNTSLKHILILPNHYETSGCTGKLKKTSEPGNFGLMRLPYYLKPFQLKKSKDRENLQYELWFERPGISSFGTNKTV